MTDFTKGIIIGFCVGIIVVGLTAALLSRHRKDKELIEYVEKQQVIETMREDYVNRDPHEFIDGFPGVRGAYDGASAEFLRKRDEAVQRFRDRNTDR
jgi:gas vesicle protein